MTLRLLGVDGPHAPVQNVGDTIPILVDPRFGARALRFGFRDDARRLAERTAA